MKKCLFISGEHNFILQRIRVNLLEDGHIFTKIEKQI